METLRTVIVEDDDYWINSFQHCLYELKEVEVVGIAKNKEEAIQVISAQKPDLVILDIELPNYGEGFEVLEILGNSIDFDIIISTAHVRSEYMMQYGDFNTLLEHSLIQILFKQELQTEPNLLVSRIQTIIQNRQSDEYQKWRAAAFKCLRTNINSDGQEKDILCDWNTYEEQIIKLKEILYIKSDQNYNHIHITDQRTKMIRGSLSKISLVLEQYQFFRIHKSYLVNLNHIERAILNNTRKTLGTGGEIHINSMPFTILPLARNQRKRFSENLIELHKNFLIN
ncbi:MAG: LytTR family DNA-binding domain-containing protein [Bacteroidota bacterium]